MNSDIVLVDLDGVCADFDQEIINRVRKIDSSIDLTHLQRKNFYFTDNFQDRRIIEIIRAIQTSPGFFRNLPIIEGALEGLHRIKDAGFHFRICSAPLRRNPTCEMDKLDWIQEHFAKYFPKIVEEAYIVNNKEKCPGLVLIDDRPKIKKAEEAEWQHVLFDQSYNQEIDTPYRLYGWKDPQLENLLNQIKESKK